jgi:hypothetical protein
VHAAANANANADGDTDTNADADHSAVWRSQLQRYRRLY